MSLSDLAALGSFISGVAVVFSFVFLALQMRQANINQRAMVHQNRTTRTADLGLRVVDPALFSALFKGNRGDADLNPQSYMQFRMILSVTFWNFEDSFFQHRLGLMEDGAFEAAAQRYRAALTSPGARAVWQQIRNQFEPEFARYCDQFAVDDRSALSLENEFDGWHKRVEEEKSLQRKVGSGSI